MIPPINRNTSRYFLHSIKEPPKHMSPLVDPGMETTTCQRRKNENEFSENDDNGVVRLRCLSHRL